MDEQAMNVAIVGAGAIAEEAHLPAWAAVPGARVRAVVDVDEQRAQCLARRWDLPLHFTDYHDVLDDPSIHVLDICLPPALHADCTVDALGAGKHVLLEKPFVTRLGDACRILDAERQSASTLMVAENWSYAFPTMKVKELLSSGELGEPLMLRAHHEGTLSLDAAEGAMPGWLLDMESAGGGYLMNAGIHMIHVARELMGDVDSLSCYMTDAGKTATTALDHETVLAGRFANQALLGVNLTGRSRHLGDRRLAFSVFGTEGVAEFDILRNEVSWTRNGTRNTVCSSDSVLGYVEEIRHFVACCRDGQEPRTSARDQAVTVATVLAAYRSARLGGPVRPNELLDEVIS